MKTSGLRLGEKILFGIAAAFVLFAVMSFVAMEIYRVHSGKKMYAADLAFRLFAGRAQWVAALSRSRLHQLSSGGAQWHQQRSQLGRHRFPAHPGLSDRLPASAGGHLRDPNDGPWRQTRGRPMSPVCPRRILHSLAVFLSELKATQGSPDARLPSEGRSGFIDEMVKIWAPSTWKSQYHDVREEGATAHDKDR